MKLSIMQDGDGDDDVIASIKLQPGAARKFAAEVERLCDVLDRRFP